MKDDNIYLKNILDKAEEAVSYCYGISREEFSQDSKTQSAVILKLVIVGEESKKLSEAVKSKIDLPWSKIAGFRDVVVHKYFDVDLEQIWETIYADIPDLTEKIKVYLNAKA
jgi:uncharacterized protein with HEPN domain